MIDDGFEDKSADDVSLDWKSLKDVGMGCDKSMVNFNYLRVKTTYRGKREYDELQGTDPGCLGMEIRTKEEQETNLAEANKKYSVANRVLP